MSKREEYETRTEQLITPIINENNFELVDIEYVREGGNWYLRAYIDKPEGITIDDCEVVSRRLNTLLDENDFIDDAYILEVSSPGLGRTLKKEKDFARSIGEDVEIKLYKAIDKQKEFEGILKSFDEDNFVIEINDKDEIFKRTDVALIKLAINF